MISFFFFHFKMAKKGLTNAQKARNKKAIECRQQQAAEKRKSNENLDQVDNVTRRKRKSVGLNTGFRESDEDSSDDDAEDDQSDDSCQDETSGTLRLMSKSSTLFVN